MNQKYLILLSMHKISNDSLLNSSGDLEQSCEANNKSLELKWLAAEEDKGQEIKGFSQTFLEVLRK